MEAWEMTNNEKLLPGGESHGGPGFSPSHAVAVGAPSQGVFPRHDLSGTARTDCRPRQKARLPPLAGKAVRLAVPDRSCLG